MNNLRKLLPFYMMMGMAGSSMPMAVDPDTISGDIIKLCPKGSFHYRFNSIGYFTKNKEMDFQEYGQCIFKCFAINDKNAKRKYQQWKINQ